MSELHPVQGVSYPRSGHKLLVSLLAACFRTPAPERIEAPGPVEELPGYFEAGPFSYCEFYGCCRSVPCRRGALFRKHHDLAGDRESALERRSDFRYVVQYRHPVPTIVSDFERTPVEREWAGIAKARAFEWVAWMEKWALGWSGPNVLHVPYDDLVTKTRPTLVAVLAQMGQAIDPARLPERLRFLRRNLGDYDVSEIVRITRPVREQVGMPDLPPGF